MRTLLFYRDFQRFSGGHLKVWDYFNHVCAAPGYAARICFSAGSLWDSSNPWLLEKEQTLKIGHDFHPNLLFLAGLDWQMLDSDRPDLAQRPILNLIQHVRHAHPNDERYCFLNRRAIRICVSGEVADALRNTRRVNGPVFAIPNGLDLQTLIAIAQQSEPQKENLVIAALKQPALGRQLADRLESFGLKTQLLIKPILRSQYLDLISRTTVTVFLPRAEEGFYLPALEGMALGTLVICPDCIGNRGFCHDGYNSFQPAMDLQSLLEAVRVGITLPLPQRQVLLANARRTAQKHDLMREREAFLEILQNVDQLW